jgi:hypothetical protein
MEKKVTSPLVKAIIITLLLAVMDIVAGFAHFKFSLWYRWVPTIILFIAFIWVAISYASQKDGNVTFGNIFSHGFKTSAIAACLSIIFALLSVLVIFPESKDVALEEARKQLEQKGDLSEENINTALEITRKFFLPFAIGGALVGTIIIGIIGSLVGAAFAKKNPQTPFQKQNP